MKAKRTMKAKQNTRAMKTMKAKKATTAMKTMKAKRATTAMKATKAIKATRVPHHVKKWHDFGWDNWVLANLIWRKQEHLVEEHWVQLG